MTEPKKRTSGEHPVVKSFRAKMESIADGEASSTLADLDASLQKYLEEIHSEPPPDTEPEQCQHGFFPEVCEDCKKDGAHGSR